MTATATATSANAGPRRLPRSAHPSTPAWGVPCRSLPIMAGVCATRTGPVACAAAAPQLYAPPPLPTMAGVCARVGVQQGRRGDAARRGTPAGRISDPKSDQNPRCPSKVVAFIGEIGIVLSSKVPLTGRPRPPAAAAANSKSDSGKVQKPLSLSPPKVFPPIDRTWCFAGSSPNHQIVYKLYTICIQSGTSACRLYTICIQPGFGAGCIQIVYNLSFPYPSVHTICIQFVYNLYTTAYK